jgi:hypothetical protein
MANFGFSHSSQARKGQQFNAGFSMRHLLILRPMRLCHTPGVILKALGTISQQRATQRRSFAFNPRVSGRALHTTWKGLQQLRDEKRPVMLWIDALCIDQTNLEERSEQVKMMARIYSQASQVVVWLGESDLYVNKAFDTMEELCWATKVRVWQYSAQKLDTPLTNVSEDAVFSFVTSETEDITCLTGPFKILRVLPLLGTFKRAISKMPLDFLDGTVEAARDKFGISGGPAQHLVSGNDELSKCLDFLRRREAVQQVFVYRSYWQKNMGRSGVPECDWSPYSM